MSPVNRCSLLPTDFFSLLLLGMQAECLALKAPLSAIACIKHCRNQEGGGHRPKAMRPRHLRHHHVRQPPLVLTYEPTFMFLISGRKVGTGPMVKASDALTDGGPSASKLRKSVEALMRPKVRATHQTEARHDGTCVIV
jgi:hypothetical protein